MKPRVALFTSCLVDQFFPQVGESLVTVLRRDFSALAQRPFRERWASLERGGSAARRAD